MKPVALLLGMLAVLLALTTLYPRVVVSGDTRAGSASWYCGKVCTKGYPAGSMVAAAGAELRVAGWRGSWVTVSHGGRSVRVQLVDWCGCPGNRIIDLYGEPFSQLAETSVGIIDVTVEYGGLEVAARPTLPPTSTEEDYTP